MIPTQPQTDRFFEHRCEQMAAVLVNAGRVVPALERDGTGQPRARWWPLPAAADRPWFEAMLPADDLARQRQLAAALAAAVDRCVRQRLLHGARSGSSPLQHGFGLPEAWLTALASGDSLLASTPDPTAANTPNPNTASALTADAEAALLQALAAWPASGRRPAAQTCCAVPLAWGNWIYRQSWSWRGWRPLGRSAPFWRAICTSAPRPWPLRRASKVSCGLTSNGACLADDMGLGKTAQLIASLLADPLQIPTLVVAPVTLLCNWRRELERFAPTLTLGLHYGPQRSRTAATLRRVIKELGPGGVLLTSYGVLSRDAAA
ncbi:MAG: SNF2-related protein, partial [Cyanobacteriota bacterium]